MAVGSACDFMVWEVSLIIGGVTPAGVSENSVNGGVNGLLLIIL